MTNLALWVKRRLELQAKGDDASLELSERVHALTELFFHFGQDRQMAAQAVRQIQDLTAPPPRYADPEPQVTYAHSADPAGVRFRQYAKDPLPAWAVDVQPFKE